MNIKTRDFGELEIDEKEIIHFRQAIFGFEKLTKYVLLCDDEVESPFVWLQSVEAENVCFILMEPDMAHFAGYAPSLPEEVVKLLELKDTAAAAMRVITVIPQHFQDATVNLKSPIVINPALKCAAQVILEADYPIRARLVAQGEGEVSC